MRSTFAAILSSLVAACTGSSSHPDVVDAADVAMDASAIVDTVDIVVDAGPPPWLVPYSPSPRASFPARFMWGAATAPYQIEGQLHGTDWYQWEQLGHIANGDIADDGPQSYPDFTRDVSTLTQMHLTAYRFGIEWARVFPTASAWAACRAADTMAAGARHAACLAAADPAALTYYHGLVSALRAASITPLVTLQHYSLPSYVNDLSQDWHSQGWMRGAIVDDLAAYATFVAADFGGDVDWWVTLNEPTAFLFAAYIAGIHPPGEGLQIVASETVMANMIHAHVAMYDAIHANDTTVASTTTPLATPTAASVSIAQNAPRFFGHDPTSADDSAAALRLDHLFNHVFLDAMIQGTFDQNFDGMIEPDEPSNDPMLRGRADYVGINYYSTEFVSYSSIIPVFHAVPQAPGADHGLPLSDYGEDIYPRGMQDTLTWAMAYGLPIVVTENGIADRADVNRARYVTEHLAAVAAAMQAGVPVLGYFYWSNLDNFEWTEGFCPEFGLFHVDRTDPSRTRTARPSASVYEQIISAGQVTDALLAAQLPYQSQTVFCALNGTPDAGM